MKTATRRTAIAMSALAMSATGTLVLTSPANAASYTVASVCGSGYTQVRSYALSGYADNSAGWGTVANVRLGYNASNGKNCAFIAKTSVNYYYGYATIMSINIRRASDRVHDNDRGDFKYYAGPVYLAAKNTCVQVSAGEAYAGSFETGWVACG